MSAATATARRRSPASSPRRGTARRHLRVVEEQPRRHPVLFLAVALAIGTLVVFGAVSFNALAAGDAVTARELGQQVVEAERLHGRLVAEVASLEDPARIRGAAEAAGMVQAEQPRFLEPGRPLPSDGAPRTAAGDDPLKPLLSADGR